MPTIAFVTSAGEIQSSDEVVVEVESASPLDHVIFVEFVQSKLRVFAAAGFGSIPAGSEEDSTITVMAEPIEVEEVTTGWRYRITDPHSLGWRGPFKVHVLAYDTDGGYADSVRSFTVGTSYTTIGIDNFDPPSGSTIGTNDSVTFDFLHTKDVPFAMFYAGYAVEGPSYVEVYEIMGAMFLGSLSPLPGYQLSSESIEGGERVTVSKDGGWARGIVMSGAGNDAGFPDMGIGPDFFGSPGGFYDVNPSTPRDVADPVTTVVSPTAGQSISATTPIVFEVTDDSGRFRRVLVAVFFASLGKTLLVHDGDTFLGGFQISSTRAMIDGGFRYTIVADAGWEASPTIRVFTFDQSGKEG